MWGPVERDGESQFPIYEDLGVGLWQTTVRWDARRADAGRRTRRNPNDPAYDWPAEIDVAIAEGGEHGIKVSLMLIGAPRWANGGRDWRWAPDDPQDFADFAEAASRRYPRVRHWMIWGEPTKASNFQPLEADEGKPLTGDEALEGPRQLRAAARRDLRRAEDASPRRTSSSAATRSPSARSRRCAGSRRSSCPTAAARAWTCGATTRSARARPKLDDVAARQRLRRLQRPRQARRRARQGATRTARASSSAT